MSKILDSAIFYWDIFLLDGKKDDLLKAYQFFKEYRDAGGTEYQSTFEAIQQAKVSKAKSLRKDADELNPPMTYEEKVRRVVAKLEDSGYDTEEEWAKSILRSIGEGT